MPETRTKRAPVAHRRRRHPPRSTAAGRKILGVLSSVADSLARGEAASPGAVVRTVTLPDEPSPYNPARVRETRALLGVSQGEFARVVGVSVFLVQSWETGRRQPSRMARRLLDLVRQKWMPLRRAAGA